MRALSSQRAAGGSICIGVGLSDGPVSRNFAALAGTLAGRGFQVKLVTHGPMAPETSVDPRVEVLRWPSARPTRLADAIYFDRLLRSLRPCCVISNFGATALMMTIGALRRVPVRIHWHHTLSAQNTLDWPKSRLFGPGFFRWRARVPYGLATHHVANSNAAKQDLLTAFGLPERKCRVFWNSIEDPGPDFSDANGKGALPMRLKFVCAGRFFPSKGQDVLLRAIACLVKRIPSVRVEFLGDGPRLQACMALADEMGILGNCIFSGKLPHRTVLTRMAEAWATIVPSRAEAFGLVNIESMALRIPVIASDTGGIREIVRDGVDGFLVPAEDHEAIASRMLELINNDPLRSQMAKNARHRFMDQFDSSKAVQSQAEWIVDTIHDSKPATN